MIKAKLTPKALFFKSRNKHWDSVYVYSRKSFNSFYHYLLGRVYSFIIPSESRILELGCGRGELLAALAPSFGVGIDFSPTTIRQAREKHPNLQFIEMNVEELDLPPQTFDFIILSDLVNDLWDIQSTLERLRPYCHPRTRLILNFHSHLWQGPLRLARRLGLATPLLCQNWVTVGDIRQLFTLSGFDALKSWSEILIPLGIPGADLVNRYLPKISPFRWLALTNFVIGLPVDLETNRTPTCSVIVAARNEEGHIEELFQRTPELGPGGTELIFVEGNSKDDTFGEIERAMARHPERNCRLYKQPGKGKGDAVRTGFAAASGDILMILDADMTVPPEDLTVFYRAIASGKGEFINGVRLVYPMEDNAMRFFNLLGNKFFAFAFTWLLGQQMRDTLCGTKVIWRRDYDRLVANRSYFGDFDPFGDFDLLFGAAKLNLKITELPIRYHTRQYGETNISRWSHGLLLLRMVIFAARRIKFF
ncbi:MAG: glycosyltransferase [Blastocatellia bacterium]